MISPDLKRFNRWAEKVYLEHSVPVDQARIDLINTIGSTLLTPGERKPQWTLTLNGDNAHLFYGHESPRGGHTEIKLDLAGTIYRLDTLSAEANVVISNDARRRFRQNAKIGYDKSLIVHSSPLSDLLPYERFTQLRKNEEVAGSSQWNVNVTLPNNGAWLDELKVLTTRRRLMGRGFAQSGWEIHESGIAWNRKGSLMHPVRKLLYLLSGLNLYNPGKIRDSMIKTMTAELTAEPMTHVQKTDLNFQYVG